MTTQAMRGRFAPRSSGVYLTVNQESAALRVRSPPRPLSIRFDPGTSPRHPGEPASAENRVFADRWWRRRASETWRASRSRQRSSRLRGVRRWSVPRRRRRSMAGPRRAATRRSASSRGRRPQDPSEPEDENQACEDEPDRRTAHRHQRDMTTGSATAATASIRRVEGVRANPSPARRLPIAVAKTSAPARPGRRGRERVRRARRRHAHDHDFTAQSLRIEVSAQDLGCADRRKLPSGP